MKCGVKEAKILKCQKLFRTKAWKRVEKFFKIKKLLLFIWMRCDENNGSMILEGNETESRFLWVVKLWMFWMGEVLMILLETVEIGDDRCEGYLW